MSHDNPTEIFRPIPEFEDYDASTFGRIASRKRNTWKILAQINSRGYRYVNLCKRHEGKKAHVVMVHHAVLRTFVGGCPPGLECRHLDGNPANNLLENLVWGTPKENQQDRVKHGTHNKGDQCPVAKLTSAQVIEIRRRRLEGEGACRLAREYGVTHGTIGHICNGRNWRSVEG